MRTNVVRGTRSPHTDWLEAQLPRERLGLTDLIPCEVLHGITTDKQFEAAQAELLKFVVFQPGGRSESRSKPL